MAVQILFDHILYFPPKGDTSQRNPVFGAFSGKQADQEPAEVLVRSRTTDRARRAGSRGTPVFAVIKMQARVCTRALRSQEQEPRWR